MLRVFPALTLILLIGPIAAGLLGTLLPAFGYLPALGRAGFSTAAWTELSAAPGLATSVRLSLVTGLATTALSFVIVVGFAAAWHGTAIFARCQRLLSPLLAIPHVAVALGFAFLIAPSGWTLRLLSPWATGYARPPDLIILQDPAGLSLIAGLVIKEVPFLFLLLLAALGQVDAERHRIVARTLGYGATAAWLKAVLPRVYPQIRLPIFAVLAYGVSVVDVALVLGPTAPPPLAVQLVRWFNDADLDLRFVASAGAIVQLALVVLAIAAWIALERLARVVGRRWLADGRRGLADRGFRGTLAGLLFVLFAVAFASLAAMALWSAAETWRFPDAFPAALTTANWLERSPGVVATTLTTLGVGLAAAAIALVLVLGDLEHETRQVEPRPLRSLWLVYLPLIVPQIAFLFGTQVLLVWADLDGGLLAVVWSHLIFVLPYVFLSLSDPYRAWDSRYGRTALCLGASPVRVFVAVKLPMLLRAAAVAAAVGFAVSIGQYLPTLFAGAGRIVTLTTEAVSLSAGGDRRLIGVVVFLQMLLPWLGFVVAAALPALVFRNRRGLQVTL
jgi:putative thiamine transport system permease protein